MKDKTFKSFEKQQSFYSELKALLVKYDVSELLQPTEPQMSLQDSFRYHALCARATLYPNKTIEEAKEIIEDTISKWNKQ